MSLLVACEPKAHRGAHARTPAGADSDASAGSDGGAASGSGSDAEHAAMLARILARKRRRPAQRAADMAMTEVVEEGEQNIGAVSRPQAPLRVDELVAAAGLDKVERKRLARVARGDQVRWAGLACSARKVAGSGVVVAARRGCWRSASTSIAGWSYVAVLRCAGCLQREQCQCYAACALLSSNAAVAFCFCTCGHRSCTPRYHTLCLSSAAHVPTLRRGCVAAGAARRTAARCARAARAQGGL